MSERVETRRGSTSVFWTRYTRAEIREGWLSSGHVHDRAVARGADCLVWDVDQSGAEELTALLLRNCAAARDAYHFDGSTLSFYHLPYRGGSSAVVDAAKAIYERWSTLGAAEAAKLDGFGPLFQPESTTPTAEPVPFSGARDRSTPKLDRLEYGEFPYGLYGGYD